jgi:hypothetical protein
VISFYRDVTGSNISVNWPMLKQINITSNTAVSLTLRDASFEKCLENTFKSVDGGQFVAIVVDRNVITITSELDLPRYMLTKTYEAKDLTQSDNIQNLALVMTNLIRNQPGGGEVQSFGDKLIITTSLQSHEQVAKLLESLCPGPSTHPTAELGHQIGAEGGVTVRSPDGTTLRADKLTVSK